MSFSYLLMGQDSLLIQCGTYLLEKEHHIKWVVTPIPSIQSWCDEHQIPWVRNLNELPASKEQSVDYLFSIVNGTILKKEDLKIARLASINYHDSLLPKYAGVHATTWSILNNEEEHGITWHLINEGIDEGDIVYQGSFPVSDNETALTLNLRCFEEAVKGFSRIIHQIETSSLTTKKQQKENRSYYGINHALPNMGFINWNTDDADSIIKLSRALNFGNYHNNVGLLKIYLVDTSLIAFEVALSNKPCSTQQAGTVLKIENGKLVVSTQSKPIVIKKLMTLEGKLISTDELSSIYNIHINSRLPQFEESTLQQHIPTYKKALQHEKYWKQELTHINEHSFFSDRMVDPYTKHQKLTPVTLAANVTKYKPEVYLLTCVMIYLYRINNYESFTAFWRHSQWSQENNQYGGLFSNLLPLSANEFQSDMSLHHLLKLINQKYELLNQNNTFLNDVLVRQPSLASVIQDAKEYIITIGHNVAKNSLIHFDIKQNSDELTIYHRINPNYQGGVLLPIIENLPVHLNNILNLLIAQPDTLIHQFSFLDEEEKAKLLTWSIGEYRPLPSNTFTYLFERMVNYSPEKTAFFDETTQLTYHQLWLEAEKVTIYLQTFNLQHQSCIGVALPPGAKMLIVILGIFKAGFICVPALSKDEFVEHSRTINQEIHDIEELLTNVSHQNLAIAPKDLSIPKQDCLLLYMESLKTFTQKQIINYCYWLANNMQMNDQSILKIDSSTPFNLMIAICLSILLKGGSLDFSSMLRH